MPNIKQRRHTPSSAESLTGTDGGEPTVVDSTSSSGGMTAGSTGPDPIAETAAPVAVKHGSHDETPPLQVPRTRAGAAYVGLTVGLLTAVLVIIFIAQNPADASVHFLTLHFKLSIGLLVLAASVAGGLLVVLVSAARLAQLRLMARRHRAGKPTHSR